MSLTENIGRRMSVYCPPKVSHKIVQEDSDDDNDNDTHEVPTGVWRPRAAFTNIAFADISSPSSTSASSSVVTTPHQETQPHRPRHADRYNIGLRRSVIETAIDEYTRERRSLLEIIDQTQIKQPKSPRLLPPLSQRDDEENDSDVLFNQPVSLHADTDIHVEHKTEDTVVVVVDQVNNEMKSDDQTDSTQILTATTSTAAAQQPTSSSHSSLSKPNSQSHSSVSSHHHHAYRSSHHHHAHHLQPIEVSVRSDRIDTYFYRRHKKMLSLTNDIYNRIYLHELLDDCWMSSYDLYNLCKLWIKTYEYDSEIFNSRILFLTHKNKELNQILCHFTQPNTFQIRLIFQWFFIIFKSFNDPLAEQVILTLLNFFHVYIYQVEIKNDQQQRHHHHHHQHHESKEHIKQKRKKVNTTSTSRTKKQTTSSPPATGDEQRLIQSKNTDEAYTEPEARDINTTILIPITPLLPTYISSYSSSSSSSSSHTSSHPSYARPHHASLVVTTDQHNILLHADISRRLNESNSSLHIKLNLLSQRISSLHSTWRRILCIWQPCVSRAIQKWKLPSLAILFYHWLHLIKKNKNRRKVWKFRIAKIHRRMELRSVTKANFITWQAHTSKVKLSTIYHEMDNLHLENENKKNELNILKHTQKKLNKKLIKATNRLNEFLLNIQIATIKEKEIRELMSIYDIQNNESLCLLDYFISFFIRLMEENEWRLVQLIYTQFQDYTTFMQSNGRDEHRRVDEFILYLTEGMKGG